jgi:hypothetical protein
MPLVVKDRVRETSTTAGTGTFTLAGAVTGYQSFSAIGNGNTTYYTIYLQGGNEWEVGIGTYTASGTTLSRDTVLASSAGGAKVSFSAGVKDVFVTYPADRSVWYDTATNVTIDALTVSNNTILGDASTDTVRVNGYMGVGGAGASTVGVNVVSAALSGATQYGIAATPVGTGTTQINGIAAAAGTSNTAFTVANASGFRAINLAKGAASTITNYHGVYVEDLTQGTNNYGITSLVSSGSNKWNIYASGTAANYFAGNVGIGTSSPQSILDVVGVSGTEQFRIGNTLGGTDFGITVTENLSAIINSAEGATGRGIQFQSGGTNTLLIDSAGNVGIGTTSPTNLLSVAGNANITGNVTLGDATTDTVTVNGYMAVGGAPTSTYVLRSRGDITNGTTAYGIGSTSTAQSGVTSNAIGLFSAVSTAAASFTVGSVRQLQAGEGTKGAGSTITEQYGLYVSDQTLGASNFGIYSGVSSGSNKWNIYASGTAQNYFAGNVGIGTSAPSSLLHLQVTTNFLSGPTLKFDLNDTGTSIDTSQSLGTIQFVGNDAQGNGVRAEIIAVTEGTSGQTGLSFGTMPAGTTPATAAIERLRIDSSGALIAKPAAGTGAVFNEDGVDADFRVESDTNTHRLFVDGGADTVLMGTTTNTNSSKLVVDGTISETVSSVQYLVASQADIGTAPNEIPLNQYLGALAYEDTETPALDVGTGISTGTGTICKANGGQMGGIYRMTILIDLTGLNSGGTAGDIIGVNGTALPCYIARLPAMTVLGGRMTCLETPAGGDTDIDLYSATEGTGVEDQAITALTETQIINAGAQTVGTVTYFSADPAANAYFYLVGQGTANATYTAGRFLIEIFGVQ